MFRIPSFSVIVLLGLMLAACGGSGSTTVATTAPAATSAPAATTAPEATAAPEAEATSAPEATSEPEAEVTSESAPTAATASGGTRTFTIVPDESEASYQVQEKFLNQDLPVQAIGTTKSISGELQFSLDGQPTGKVTNITVDLRTLASDSDRRDQRIRSQWLESDKYPYAVFNSTEVQDAPSSYTDGEEISFKLVGDMTIRDVTKQVTWDVTGKLDGNTITGTATTLILMKDFGFDPPEIAGMLTVDDGVTLTVNFTAREE